ncbi:MAG: polyprenyl synthetase family protein [Paludibacteraceae bacterium]|nr:polyprenyl synthetase family protein [Paludibacteraceae bacterium]
MDINREIGKLDWSKEPKGLYEPIAYTLSAGGKRLRPTLALLGAECEMQNAECKMQNAECRMQNAECKMEDVVQVALALEVFHNFTLLHDDVMDKAEVRRGRATVHVRWNENTAILSGDQMLIEAYKLLSGIQADKLPTVLRLFNKMATEICEGQQYDMDYELREDVSIEEYMKMIRLKTSVLLATALQIGAYMAGANEDRQHALYEYGIALGMAFQLQDDYLDCYGDEATFGKAIGGDIREGKKTFMLLMAKQLANAEQLKELESRNYERVIAVYDQLGIDGKAQQKISEYTSQALEWLEKVPQNEATQQLRTMAEKLLKRER